MPGVQWRAFHIRASLQRHLHRSRRSTGRHVRDQFQPPAVAARIGAAVIFITANDNDTTRGRPAMPARLYPAPAKSCRRDRRLQRNAQFQLTALGARTARGLPSVISDGAPRRRSLQPATPSPTPAGIALRTMYLRTMHRVNVPIAIGQTGSASLWLVRNSKAPGDIMQAQRGVIAFDCACRASPCGRQGLARRGGARQPGRVADAVHPHTATASPLRAPPERQLPNDNRRNHQRCFSGGATARTSRASPGLSLADGHRATNAFGARGAAPRASWNRRRSEVAVRDSANPEESLAGRTRSSGHQYCLCGAERPADIIDLFLCAKAAVGVVERSEPCEHSEDADVLRPQQDGAAGNGGIDRLRLTSGQGARRPAARAVMMEDWICAKTSSVGAASLDGRDERQRRCSSCCSPRARESEALRREEDRHVA